MDHKQAVDFMHATDLIAKVLEVPLRDVHLSLCILADKDRINEAINLYNEFREMDIVERGKVFGIDVFVKEAAHG